LKNRQYFLTLNLKNDESLISIFEEHYQKGKVWPEILNSWSAAGILNMDMFRSGTCLLVVITVDKFFSIEKKIELDRTNLKVREWEELMDGFYSTDLKGLNENGWQLMSKVCSHDLSTINFTPCHSNLWGGL